MLRLILFTLFYLCSAVLASDYKVYGPENYSVNSADGERILFIMDFSNSMTEYLEGREKVDLMIETMAKILPSISPDTQVGLRVYGHKKFYCGNNVQVDGNIDAGRTITGNKFVASGLYTTALNAANVFVSGNAIYDTSNSDVVVAGGNCRPIIRWGERNSNGWRTRYLISSAREDNNSWGRLFIAVSNSDAGTSLGCSFSLYGAGYAKIEGNLLVTGGGTFYSSDVRAKTIIERPKLSLNSIANSPVIKFRWNGYNGLKDDNKLHVGGIAQYIEKILPECVVGQKDDFLSFDYATTGYIFSVLTARHLLSYETRTDRIIRKLKERIRRLERQLNIENHEEVCFVAD